MLAAYFAIGTGVVILGVYLLARWLDMTPAQRAFRAWKRAHRNAQRRVTIIHERGHDAQIVGDGAWR